MRELIGVVAIILLLTHGRTANDTVVSHIPITLYVEKAYVRSLLPLRLTGASDPNYYCRTYVKAILACPFVTLRHGSGEQLRTNGSMVLSFFVGYFFAPQGEK